MQSWRFGVDGRQDTVQNRFNPQFVVPEWQRQVVDGLSSAGLFVGRKGLEFQFPVLLDQLFDALLRMSQGLFTRPGQGHATLKVFQGLFEGLVTLFHPFDQLLKFIEVTFESGQVALPVVIVVVCLLGHC